MVSFMCWESRKFKSKDNRLPKDQLYVIRTEGANKMGMKMDGRASYVNMEIIHTVINYFSRQSPL